MKSYEEYRAKVEKLYADKVEKEKNIQEIQDRLNQAYEKLRKMIAKKFDHLFAPAREELEKSNARLYRVSTTLKNYSTFNTDDINRLFAACAMFVEGQRFVPLVDYSKTHRGEICRFPHWSVIVSESSLKNFIYLDDYTISELIKNGEAFQLSKASLSTMSFFDDYGKPYFDFGKFEYLEGLLKQLVESRLSTGKGKVSMVTQEDLDAALTTFLLANPDLCNKCKDEREEMFEQPDEDYITIDSSIMPLCRKMDNAYNNLNE